MKKYRDFFTRVDKIQDHYKQNEGLCYWKIINSEKWARYPPQEVRNDLIMSAHLLGHFGVAATLNRLQERYFWKKMATQEESLIKRCSTCQRHKRLPIIHDEALTIDCDSIFDHIVMDCSLIFFWHHQIITTVFWSLCVSSQNFRSFIYWNQKVWMK